MANAGALQRLRESTSAAHEALEHSDLVMPSTRDGARYARLIGAMWSFHRAVEREFRRYELELDERGLSLSGRYKSELLRAESGELRSPAIAEPQLHFSSAAEAAGALYVMEGSTLGGMLIAKSIMEHQGRVSRYYGCYGKTTAARWRSTSAQLDAFPRENADVESMVAGANSTFDALHRHLTQALAA